MANFTWTPDRGASRSTKAAVLTAKFGDGYSQRTGDGINSISEVWSLSFSVRTKTEVLAISAFLATARGVFNFTWTTPRGTTLKFTCDNWDEAFNHEGDCSISMSFTQDFGL